VPFDFEEFAGCQECARISLARFSQVSVCIVYPLEKLFFCGKTCLKWREVHQPGLIEGALPFQLPLDMLMGSKNPQLALAAP